MLWVHCVKYRIQINKMETYEELWRTKDIYELKVFCHHHLTYFHWVCLQETACPCRATVGQRNGMDTLTWETGILKWEQCDPSWQAAFGKIRSYQWQPMIQDDISYRSLNLNQPLAGICSLLLEFMIPQNLKLEQCLMSTAFLFQESPVLLQPLPSPAAHEQCTA